MENFTKITLLLIGATFSISLAAFDFLSIAEKEKRAAHNLVRWGIAHSGFFRRFALQMDNLFYGRKPNPRPAPKWTDYKK
ncbi:MAG: hypothetical protein DRI32_07640 [Chloroflexi bacterium]|nr:MAG: hypothetical protein DRI32_07640 [Chloroflexota bacterium]